MRARRVGLALVATLLAGCFGGPAEHPAPLSQAPAAAPNATPPEGRNGTILAFSETNRTENGTGGSEHRHDYWMGRSRVTLLDGTFGMAAAAPGASPAATALLALTPTALVYEGTGAVELTFSSPSRRACEPLVYMDGQPVCTDAAAPAPGDPSGGPARLKLQARHAASAAWIDAGEVVWDKPIVLPVRDPRMTDMPHSTHTLWAFRVVTDDAAQQTLVFHAKAEAVRAPGEIPLWPGHPDLYADGRHARVVYQASVHSQEPGVESLATGAASPNATEVAPAKVVSYGTRTLFVWANVTGFKTALPDASVDAWSLRLHNSSGAWLRAPLRTGDAKSLNWTLAVDEEGMDSPYADASRWGFVLTASVQAPEVRCSGCVAYEVTYDLTIVASDLAQPAYDKLT